MMNWNGRPYTKVRINPGGFASPIGSLATAGATARGPLPPLWALMATKPSAVSGSGAVVHSVLTAGSASVVAPVQGQDRACNQIPARSLASCGAPAGGNFRGPRPAPPAFGLGVTG